MSETKTATNSPLKHNPNSFLQISRISIKFNRFYILMASSTFVHADTIDISNLSSWQYPTLTVIRLFAKYVHFHILLIEHTVEEPSKLSTVNCSIWKGLLDSNHTKSKKLRRGTLPVFEPESRLPKKFPCVTSPFEEFLRLEFFSFSVVLILRQTSDSYQGSLEVCGCFWMNNVLI